MSLSSIIDFLSSPATNSTIALLSFLSTTVASIVAVTTILIWRKQQLLSSKFNLIMDLEDNFDIFTASYYRDYILLQGLLSALNNKTNNKQEMIKIYMTEKSKTEELIKERMNYDLAFLRLKRIEPSIIDHKELDANFHIDFLTKQTEILSKSNFFDKEEVDVKIKEFTLAFSDLKKAGTEILIKYREKYQ